MGQPGGANLVQHRRRNGPALADQKGRRDSADRSRQAVGDAVGGTGPQIGDGRAPAGTGTGYPGRRANHHAGGANTGEKGVALKIEGARHHRRRRWRQAGAAAQPIARAQPRGRTMNPHPHPRRGRRRRHRTEAHIVEN